LILPDVSYMANFLGGNSIGGFSLPLFQVSFISDICVNIIHSIYKFS